MLANLGNNQINIKQNIEYQFATVLLLLTQFTRFSSTTKQVNQSAEQRK